MLLLALLACAGTPSGDSPDDTGDTDPPPDAETVLIELATEVTTDLYEALYFTVGEDTLLAMAPDDVLEGTLAFPDDADPAHWDTDGATDIEWLVLYGEDAGVRTWTWDTHLEELTLTLPSVTVTGRANWMVSWESYDSELGTHVWSSSLSIDGGDPVSVSFGAYATFTTLNALNGSLDERLVTWENPDPDVP